MRLFGTIFAGLPLAVAANTALAYPGDWSPGYSHMMGGYGFFGGGLMMLVFWGLVIALIVYGVRWLGENRRGGAARRDDALEILRDRFARGEIDEDEFKRRKAALES